MKSDEEIAQEMQAKEYQDLQLREQPPYPDILYVPNNPLPQHAGFQPSNAPPMTEHGPSAPMDQMIQEPTMKLLYYAKIVRWVSVIEAIISFVFLIMRFGPLALLALISFSGYIAGLKFHKGWSIVFMLFICLELIAKFVLILIHGRVLEIVVFGLISFAVDLYILALTFRFFRLLRRVTEVERLELICLRKQEAFNEHF